MAASRLRPPILPGGLDAPSGRKPAPTRNPPAGWQGHLLALPATRSGKELSRRTSPRAGAATLSGRSGGSSGLLVPQIPHVSHRRSARRGAWHGWPCAWEKRDPPAPPPWQAIPYPSGALALPLGGERTERYAQGRVAVQRTLPPGIERTETVRSGPSGSASGTLGGEWQCVRYARGRVAVRLTLPLDGERTARCVSHCHPVVNVRDGTFRSEWQYRLVWPATP